MVGKWHCGHATEDHIPAGRGYETSLNYMDAANDYWNNQFSSCLDKQGNPTLTDLWDTRGPAVGQNASWACSQTRQAGCTWEDDVLLARLLKTITAHNATEPLFLFWAAHTVHEPYEVPDADLARFASIDIPIRRYYAAMISHLDSLVATLVDALKAKGLYEQTLFIVTSDNGGPVTNGPPDPTLQSGGGANNFPLRGGKIGIMEGGIRLNAFVSGGFLPAALRGTTYEGFMHLEDWYTTLCALAGVDPTDRRAAAAGLPPVDGLDMSPIILGTNATSPRTEIVIGSSDDSDHAGNTIVAGVINADGYKLLLGRVDPAFYQGEVYPNSSTTAKEPPLVCGDPDASGSAYGPGCLFNVLTDPGETTDLAASQPALVKTLRRRITELQATVYNPDRGSTARTMCLTGLSKWGGFLGPFLP